ncbi:MAG: 2-oxo acid dehydrogenase subunit E2 [Chloroflexaceae bacterium]|nr:2-oxo acid dehydrogenase subunit E2 [Chloroflexaceae bacterium]
MPLPTVLPAAPDDIDDLVVPLSAMRRTIAEHMVRSVQTSPHVTTVMEVDLAAVGAHRAAHRNEFAQWGVRLTYTAYMVAATAAALLKHPAVNASWHENGIRLHRVINIGVATALGEAGLIVPVIKDADEKSLTGLARAINDLSLRARAGQLAAEEVRGGTFTITNHGTSGSLMATPIIHQPQCAILGMGAIEQRVKVVQGMLAIRPMAYLGLTFDHRMLDGAGADGFLASVKQHLEAWQ